MASGNVVQFGAAGLVAREIVAGQKCPCSAGWLGSTPVSMSATIPEPDTLNTFCARPTRMICARRLIHVPVRNRVP